MPDAPQNSRLTVLVVDGDPAVRHAIKFSLEAEGFAVSTYASGHELLDREDIPDAGCLIIEYNLLGMNGLELLVQLGNRDVSLPAILIATHPSAALRHKVATNGHHLIEKPLLGDTLIRCIRDIFTD